MATRLELEAPPPDLRQGLLAPEPPAGLSPAPAVRGFNDGEQDDLILAAQAGDAGAMDALVERHIKLVHAAAKRFSGADASEVTQSGCVGLVEAIRRFDTTRRVRFSTYAVPYILGEIRHFLRTDHAVHIPRALQDAGRLAARTSAILAGRLGREPTIQEVAAELHTSAEELALAMESRSAPISLDAPISEDDSTLGDSLGDASSSVSFERVLARDILDRCDPKERALLTMRFFKGMSQADCARVLGISQPQLSRVEKRLLSRLREEAS